MIKYISYPIIGGVLGCILGGFFGFVFDSFYTKKNDLEQKQKYQAIIFSIMGGVGGVLLGLKVAEEEVKNEKEKRIFEESLKISKCNFCNTNFEYSFLYYDEKKYCDNCISKIKKDYILKCTQINSCVNKIEELKKISAILKRLDKVDLIAMSMMDYEDVDLEFITKKPSEILKSTEDYRNGLKI
ncbi:hypothetical protein [Flavobacterium sp. GSA192]|uniref:hypothetical protein n=1 Tax=Flavobacterium sp. GSA192 TaxID=2576304 RepID=UPI0011268F9C|nr:hypothetical protein [Flavobacterium sp. GSA192]